MNFDELQKSGEGQNLEFKTSFGKETTETVVAFCNTSGGTLLIGVDKTGTVKGVTVNGEILKGNYIAIHRNKLLAEAFYLRGDIEKFGTGFFRIQSELQNSPELGLNIETLNGFTRSILEVKTQVTPQDTPQDKLLKYSKIGQDSLEDNKNTPQDTPQDSVRVDVLVDNLLAVLTGELTRIEIQGLLSLKNRKNFRKYYLKPALDSGLIEMTIPDKPNSKHQKYRLTEKGKRMKRNNE